MWAPRSCAGLVLASLTSWNAVAQDDGTALRAQLLQTYPSLAYVERYRRQFPTDTQGDEKLWSTETQAPALRTGADLVHALLGLQDQHVVLGGAKAGKTESPGVLFRTSTDGHMVVWRVFDPSAPGLSPGDVVLTIEGVPTSRWLTRAAAKTFGGNRRSRVAEAALELGLGSPFVHQTAGLGPSVHLKVQSGRQTPRTVVLAFTAMSQERARAMTEAINRPDLPARIDIKGCRIATVRLGAFAPQFDPVFLAASEDAEKAPGTTEDQAMLAGFCAVTRAFIAQVDAVNGSADLLVVDLRGNLGGFGREARLLAESLTTAALPNSFDAVATGKPGTLHLTRLVEDPSCGKIRTPHPIIVLTDAGTRSAGELMAAWLWASGARVVGERTIGAGGGRDADAQGFPLPNLGFMVKTSGNFTFFDCGETLHAGDISEKALIDLVAQDHFSPSRTHPFAIQAVGLRPDLERPTTLDDLRDGGLAQVKRAVVMLKQQKRLP